MGPHRTKPVDVAVVREVARDRWLAVLARVAPELDAALAHLGRHVPCPVHGGTDGFRLFKDADETGGGICNTCGAFPDGFELLMWLKGWRFPETLHAVAEALGLGDGMHWTIPPARRAPPQEKRAQKERETRSFAKAIARVWQESLSPKDARAAPLHQYLLRRGLDRNLLDPRIVRFHPALPYWDEEETGRPREVGRFPALVCRVSDRYGKPVTLHRTYLTSGGKKAPVPKSKKLMAYPDDRELAGGAIRLCEPRAELGLTEGVENALAVRGMSDMAVWPALSATLLELFEPPPCTSLLVIWADKDRNGRGEEAANKLRQRMLERDIQVAVHLPPGEIPDGAKGLDWDDVWVQRLAAVA